MNDKAKRIIKLRNSIDPATGRVYTLERIRRIENCSQSLVSQTLYPNHIVNRRRRTRLVKAIQQKSDQLILEDPKQAKELANWLNRRLEGHA